MPTAHAVDRPRGPAWDPTHEVLCRPLMSWWVLFSCWDLRCCVDSMHGAHSHP